LARDFTAFALVWPEIFWTAAVAAFRVASASAWGVRQAYQCRIGYSDLRAAATARGGGSRLRVTHLDERDSLLRRAQRGSRLRHRFVQRLLLLRAALKHALLLRHRLREVSIRSARRRRNGG